MLWQEKLMEKAIHLQEAVAIQKNLVAFNAKKTPVLQALNCFAKSFCQVHAKFLFEVSAAHVTQFQLQNKFTNQPFILTWGQGSPDWQSALVHSGDIGLEIVLVLVMRAINVAERGHSCR